MVDSGSPLRCVACGNRYGSTPTDPWRCRCGGPLEYASLPVPATGPPAITTIDTRPGLWAFDGFLPVDPLVTLGEGFTPLVSSPDWGCQFKLDYVFPTGSFKDRGATTLLSLASSLGVDTVVEDSSGNAGAAVAAYAARAGIDAVIYVPAGVKSSKLAAIERTGATAVRVDGGREAVSQACIDAVDSGKGWYASHAWNPAFFAGTMTVAFEIGIQRDWDVPDAIVVPVGHGTMLLGAYWGFERLHAAGWIEAMPRILGVQAAGYAPIAERYHGSDGEVNDLADGVQISDPVRRDRIFEAIERTDGDVIALPEPPVRRTLDRLHRRGFYVEPTSALAPAGLERYRERGLIGPDADVVVPLTGSGLKR